MGGHITGHVCPAGDVRQTAAKIGTGSRSYWGPAGVIQLTSGQRQTVHWEKG